MTVRYVARGAGAGVGSGREAAAPVAYPDNPNGSAANAAGICDRTGRVFGLMPHPEAFVRPEHHPEWTRGGVSAGDGLSIFVNGVAAARRAAGP